MKSNAHLFDLACLTGDLERADAQFHALERDEWVRTFGQFRLTSTWTARYTLLMGDWAQACALYRAMLDDELRRAAEEVAREGAARDWLDYGRALIGAGRTGEAEQILTRAMRLPDYAANWPWKPTIAQRLDAPLPGSSA
jgi:hypothetical protein